MNKFVKIFFNRGSSLAYAIITAVFTFVPEGAFSSFKVYADWSDVMSCMVNRLIVGAFIFFLVNILYCVYRGKRRKVSVRGHNFSIKIEYGDIFNITGGKKVIAFDECFTVKIGDRPEDVKENSVCGQYLRRSPMLNIQELIDAAKIKPTESKSAFNGKTRYELGTLVPNGEFLLMAFTKLDENGRGYLTYEDYLGCLEKLWEQIDIYHGTDDVYITILGSKITRFDMELTQQQLLDIMISSYRLSPKKMQSQYTLHIICKKCEGFSLNNIFGAD